MPHTRQRIIIKKYLVWDEFFGVDRLVWEGGFSNSSQTSLGKAIFTNTQDKIDTLLKNVILSWTIFLVVDRLVWEEIFSITSQTGLAKEIFTNTPDQINSLLCK